MKSIGVNRDRLPPAKLPGITEKQFQAQIVKAAKLLGWYVYHTYDSRRSAPGFPDLVLCDTRRVIYAEIKVGRNLLSADQEKWVDALRRTHATVFVWRPEDWPQIEAELFDTPRGWGAGKCDPKKEPIKTRPF